MRTKRLIYFVFTVLLLGQNHSAFAQSQSSLERRAAQAFEQQNYASALVDYRQLLAKDQQNPNFNYHYGVCLFEVENHFEAAKYFDVALGLKQIPDPLLYYYRAQIFQEQYFFAQAIKAYENYQQLSQQSKAPRDVSRQIAECQRGLKEVSAFIRLPLLALQTTKSPKFYTAFPFTADDYTFYEAPEVHSKNNAKHGHVPVYAYKRGMKYRILASYGSKGTQLDLYLQKKDANNNWDSPQLIGGGVNDPIGNETYGFYDAASQTLYFSSTAQSIGAHDLFKASFDLATNTATAIEKMPYPYASPSDDLFYVCDAAQNQAYFATSRQGVVGQYEIYTLQLDGPVRPNFVFAGLFSNELQPESKSLSLQFTDLLTSEVYGPFVSDAAGAYQVALPQKGEFLLEIQVDGASKVYQTRFSIPILKPNTILQQQVLYFSDELGKEQWQVRNQLLDQDPATQIAGLSKLQMNVAKGQLLQAKTSALEGNKPLQASLATTWGFAAQDTAAFITQMIDTLLAAEVSLENQVRLMELLRQDFEQQLNSREQLLAKLGQSITQPSSVTEREELLQELAIVENELAFNQRWIQINQAANIPDLVLLDTLRAMNERHQALLLTNDSLTLLAGWTQQQATLQQYLEIAAFDGASALEAAALEQQRGLQKLIQEEAAIKTQQQQVAQQIKQLQTALPLQSKKEQAQTQLQIAARERESKELAATAVQLRSEREAAAAELQVFDQASRKASYLKAAENQSLPKINLQSSYDELLAQYAQQQDLSQNLKSQLATTNPISTENGNVATTTPENGNLGSNQELGNTVIVNSNRSSTENGNTTSTNPISTENGNVATTTPENGNLGSNQELGNTEIVNSNRTSTENGNTTSTNPISTENGNVVTTTPENGNLGSNQELGNTEIVNSNRTSSENGNTTSTNSVSSENGNIVTTTPENGNVSATSPELIQEKISRFEQELLAISMINSEELPITLPKIQRLGLSNEALDRLEQQLALPVSEATEPVAEVEAYVNYVEQRRVFEQTKNELVRNQQELREMEENFRPEDKEQLAALILAQVQLQERLNAQQQALVALPNQAVYEALLQQNYRPQLSAQVELTQGVRSAAVAGSVFAVQDRQAQTQATPLPVGLPCPQGLVFRVQVGAFRKPVPAERFREFTPVDGQVLANGLTVYMAGYFSTSAEALKQQKLIRTLGYPDAFVVAYQNCSRLSLAQGRALESTTTLAQTENIANSSVFAGPGQGLYYTVQVGVYNRPLTSEAQIGLSELIEAKTAKGQYRYASGKFGNLKDAKTRQQLAVAKGITDAFIVAYYQGKRIDLAQAKLLAQSGIAFEQNFEQIQVPALSAALQQKVLALELPQTQPLKVPDPVLRYEAKCTACQAELSRYNRVGVFIYDPEKDLIMSALQKASEWDVVQLMYMKELRKKTPTLKGETQTLELDLDGLDGAFMDWLLRQANSYELSKDQQGKLQLRFVLPSAD
ncbi:MAG: hypothetical protein RL440_1571 [Bacteroidota bacterium]